MNLSMNVLHLMRVLTFWSVFVPRKNTPFARHIHANCKQQNNVSIYQYLQALKTLSKECEFFVVDANAYRDESVRDHFISGLAWLIFDNVY